MDRLYQSSSETLRQAQMALARLEQASDERDAQQISQAIQEKIRSIEDGCREMEFYVNREPPNKKHIARMKIDQLKLDAQHAQRAIENIYGRITARFRAAATREELLTHRFRTNESVALSMDDFQLTMHDSLNSSNRQVDDLLSQGAAVLENLKFQHMNLKGVSRKMHDIGAALGLSSTTLQMIERRVKEDWLIFLVGCIATLIFMYCFYQYWKHW